MTESESKPVWMICVIQAVLSYTVRCIQNHNSLSLLPNPGHALVTLGLPMCPSIYSQIYKRTSNKQRVSFCLLGIFQCPFMKKRHSRRAESKLPNTQTRCMAERTASPQQQIPNPHFNSSSQSCHLTGFMSGLSAVTLACMSSLRLHGWKLFWTCLFSSLFLE